MVSVQLEVGQLVGVKIESIADLVFGLPFCGWPERAGLSPMDAVEGAMSVAA